VEVAVACAPDAAVCVAGASLGLTERAHLSERLAAVHVHHRPAGAQLPPLQGHAGTRGHVRQQTVIAIEPVLRRVGAQHDRAPLRAVIEQPVTVVIAHASECEPVHVRARLPSTALHRHTRAPGLGRVDPDQAHGVMRAPRAVGPHLDRVAVDNLGDASVDPLRAPRPATVAGAAAISVGGQTRARQALAVDAVAVAVAGVFRSLRRRLVGVIVTRRRRVGGRGNRHDRSGGQRARQHPP
jgi:hypothetical protein